MQIEPYLSFYGRCEEALAYYKSVLGGDYEVSRFSDGPMADDMPADWKTKIMHATFRFDGGEFMASDSRPDDVPVTDSNVSLSLSMTDEARADRVFTALADGGRVDMPLQKTFWGATFGMLKDRFGIFWMVNCQSE